MSTKIVKKLLAADVTDFIQDTADAAQSNAQAYADQKIADLVDSAPATLDTLNELAAALNDDASFASTVAGQIGGLQSEIDAVEGRMDIAEADILALEGRMDTAESDIDAEVARATAAEGAIQSELDATQAGAGLAIDGSYVLNPSTNYINAATSLAAADNALDGAIKIVSDNLVTAQGEIDAVEGRMTTAEADIDALEGRMNTAESDIDALEVSASTASTQISGLDGRLTTAESDIDALEVRMTTAEGDIDAVEVRMTTAEVEIDGLQSADVALSGRLDVLEGADTVEGSVAKAEKDAKDYTDAREVAITAAYQAYADQAELDAISSANSYTDAEIAALVDSAPAVLDTLNELAQALGSDPSFATTVAGQIGGIQSELDVTQTGAGLGTDGSYAAPAVSNYLSAATSLKDADSKLDTQIKVVADGLAQEILDRVADVDAEESRALGAEAIIAGNLAQEILDRVADVDAEEIRALAAEAVIAGDLAQEILDRAADVDAEESRALAAEGLLSGRLDVLEGADTVEGSVAKAEKDAKDYTDAREVAITSAYQAYADQAEADAITSANAYTDAEVAILEAEDLTLVKLDGSRVMSGDLDMGGNQISDVADPVLAQDAATKAYVDGLVAGVNSAAEISFAPAGDIVATNVQAAIEEVEADYKAYADAKVVILENEDLTFLKLDGSRNMTGQLTVESTVGEPTYLTSSSLAFDNNAGSVSGVQSLTLSNGGVIQVQGAQIEIGASLNMSSQAITDVLDPVSAQDAATKAYVDSAVAGVNQASEISFAPAGDIAATNVQAAIEELESDYKAYADQAELDAIASANSYTDGAVAAINAAALVGVKSAKTLDATDISNQYVDLAHEIKADTLIVVFRGLVLEQGPAGGPNADYSVSTVGGVTRVTFEGDFASAGTSALVANDRLRFQYLRPAGV